MRDINICGTSDVIKTIPIRPKSKVCKFTSLNLEKSTRPNLAIKEASETPNAASITKIKTRNRVDFVTIDSNTIVKLNYNSRTNVSGTDITKSSKKISPYDIH